MVYFPLNFGRKTVVACCLLATVVAYLVIWQTDLIGCLASVGYCYLSWINPKLNVITQDDIVATAGAKPIPKIIHQTWKNEQIPERWLEAYKSCKDLHPDYEYKLWTDATAREFVSRHYPWFLSTYDNYPFVIQKADVIRYLVLFKYGGAYIDLDVGCRERLDDLRQFDLVLPMTHPIGFSNEFLMSAPEHPFMLKLIVKLPRWSRTFGSKYPTVMFSTGPMFVTVQYSLYRDKDSLHVLPDNFYGKYSNESEAYLRHYAGSSWHGDDAQFVLWLYQHWQPLVLVPVGILVVAMPLVIWTLLCDRYKTRIL